MLDGIIASRLFVDDSEVPTWALLQELAEGNVYIGGRPTRDTTLPKNAGIDPQAARPVPVSEFSNGRRLAKKNVWYTSS